MKGALKYLFAMMDDETRFLIAQEVAETKEKHDARHLFFKAKRLMGKQPRVLITDGLPSYAAASEQVFEGTKQYKRNRAQRLNSQQQNGASLMAKSVIVKRQ